MGDHAHLRHVEWRLAELQKRRRGRVISIAEDEMQGDRITLLVSGGGAPAGLLGWDGQDRRASWTREDLSRLTLAILCALKDRERTSNLDDSPVAVPVREIMHAIGG